MNNSSPEVLNDLIKIGIPSLIGLATAVITAILAYKSKRIDSNTAKWQGKHLSVSTLIERKRQYIENCSENFDEFENSFAVFYTQIIAKSVLVLNGNTVSQQIEDKLLEYELLTWQAFSNANKCKRILQLIGCFELSEQVIELMRHCSTSRNLYQENKRNHINCDIQEIELQFQQFRNKCKIFLRDLSECYNNLVADEE